MTAPLSPAQAEHLARIEAAPDAEESLRERVARAMWLADPDARDRENPMAAQTWPPREAYLHMADAAIAVICTPAADAHLKRRPPIPPPNPLLMATLDGDPAVPLNEPAPPAPATAGTWRHFRWHEPHEAVPAPGTEYPDPSGKTGARCANCPDGEAIGFAPAAAADTQGGGR